MKRYSTRSGFTIVELLIVIVVIAILASLTVVGFNNAQRTARNGARLAAGSAAIEAVKVVLTKKTPTEVQAAMGQNPGDDWWRACIGTGHPSVGGKNACGYYGSTVYVWEVDTFNTLLTSIAGPVDVSRYPATQSTGGDTVTGPYIETAWVDGKSMLAVEYSLEGTGQKCNVNNEPLIYRLSDGSNTLTAPSGSAADYTSSGSGITECIVAAATSY
ncbi:MAG TPA: type II secretion system protein [Candidatus Saccharimonadales bacterium]|nr:type II secretion system protein [Candidatus Saccharimonadales bacterium]